MSAWLGGQGIVRDPERGEVWPVVDRLERWAARAEDVIRELLAERQDARRERSMVVELATRKQT